MRQLLTIANDMNRPCPSTDGGHSNRSDHNHLKITVTVDGGQGAARVPKTFGYIDFRSAPLISSTALVESHNVGFIV